MSQLPEGRKPLLWKDMPFAERPKAHPSTERLEIDKLKEEIRTLTTSGIAEVAARNPNVMEYMRHWESRTEKAEARVAELEARIATAEKNPGS
jgi:DnaJ-domain-containing protein 1